MHPQESQTGRCPVTDVKGWWWWWWWRGADGVTWAFCPGTLHLNDITQMHRQNNTSTVKYKWDRLSDTTNRRPDRQPVMTDSIKADRQAQGQRMTD